MEDFRWEGWGLLSMMANWTAWDYIASVADIAILSFAIYKLLLLIRGTRAVQLLKGIFAILVLSLVSEFVGLHAVQWILDQIWAVIFLILVVIFQPEIRRALEQIGRGRLFSGRTTLTTGDLAHLIDAMVDAAVSCAKTKTGALLVVERETGLNDYIESGIPVDAKVTKELLLNIFVPNTPLHDGAAIIRGDRVAAAACFLPLSDNPYISMALGTRHRAGIGITEVSDAVVLIVSEETGAISLAQDGKLARHLDERQLRESLTNQLSNSTGSAVPFWKKGGAA